MTEPEKSTNFTLIKKASLSIPHVAFWTFDISGHSFSINEMEEIKFRNIIQNFLQLLGIMSMKPKKSFTLRSQFLNY